MVPLVPLVSNTTDTWAEQGLVFSLWPALVLRGMPKRAFASFSLPLAVEIALLETILGGHAII
jgi:hypothetical protein